MATTAPDSHMGVQVPLISAMKSISVILFSNVLYSYTNILLSFTVDCEPIFFSQILIAQK